VYYRTKFTELVPVNYYGYINKYYSNGVPIYFLRIVSADVLSKDYVNIWQC